jgi:hypothetical protein
MREFKDSITGADEEPKPKLAVPDDVGQPDRPIRDTVDRESR